MKTTRKLGALAALLMVLSLSGCWDDDDDDTPLPASTEVPDSAGLSSGAFFSFILSLGVNDESSEPLTINAAFAVPPDESAEPTVLP